MDKYQRNRRYIYSEYLAMFSDEDMPKDEDKTSPEGEEEKTDYPA
jgi:hypothetical protein